MCQEIFWLSPPLAKPQSKYLVARAAMLGVFLIAMAVKLCPLLVTLAIRYGVGVAGEDRYGSCIAVNRD